jgi:hypothetical protein
MMTATQNGTQALTIDSPEIAAFLTAWHDNGRASFEKSYPSLNYDRDEAKTANNRRRWIALDRGTSGVLLVDKLTHEVWPIEAYGRPNLRYPQGTIEALTAKLIEATATQRTMRI